MLRFGTLGPAGSNHDWVTRRYLAAGGLDGAGLRLFGDFDAALDALVAGALDHVVQAAVHPATARCVARFAEGAHLVDAFLSPSQPMAVLTRADVERPRSIGLQPATRGYVDLSRWQRVVEEPTTVAVSEGLLAGRYDSGLTLERFASEHAGQLRVDLAVGAVTDAWLVYGAEPADRLALDEALRAGAGARRRLRGNA